MYQKELKSHDDLRREYEEMKCQVTYLESKN